tara:strand:+ start:298 stop:816 length:519 start_codon:yes stop_codon:yes gene_type:complete
MGNQTSYQESNLSWKIKSLLSSPEFEEYIPLQVDGVGVFLTEYNKYSKNITHEFYRFDEISNVLLFKKIKKHLEIEKLYFEKICNINYKEIKTITHERICFERICNVQRMKIKKKKELKKKFKTNHHSIQGFVKELSRKNINYIFRKYNLFKEEYISTLWASCILCTEKHTF